MTSSIFSKEFKAVVDSAQKNPKTMPFPYHENSDYFGMPDVQTYLNSKNSDGYFPSPTDWRDKWIYFIMTDRFFNPAGKPASIGTGTNWDQPYDKFQGGNLRGIAKKMDYISDLGAGAIWITPPFKNCIYNDNTYHGYGIQDFLNVDPRFGTEEDLADLVKSAHKKGIYVIFDIVLNHVGSVFKYMVNGNALDDIDFVNYKLPVKWLDKKGKTKYDDPKQAAHPDEAVFPSELKDNIYFRRQGKKHAQIGDFESLKELVTENEAVRQVLIQSYQYIIAKYDIVGFRIDTLKYIEPEFANLFGNSIREFALSIGKKNFFMFGEVWESNDFKKMATFYGKNTRSGDEFIGVDSLLDFPLFHLLPNVISTWNSPGELIEMMQKRKQYFKEVVTTHGDGSKYFVTFLDNHDLDHRINTGKAGAYKKQVTMALGALFTLQGIPCIYYGTEQGLSAPGGKQFEGVREALWGKSKAFTRTHDYVKCIREIGRIRDENPALRYGRQYFREVSGNGTHFGFSFYKPGILAYSRILSNTEIMVVMNTDTINAQNINVLIDNKLNKNGDTWEIIYSNTGKAATGNVNVIPAGQANINGNTNSADLAYLSTATDPMEIQIWKKNVQGK